MTVIDPIGLIHSLLNLVSEFDTFIMIDATTSTMLEPLPSISKIKLGLSWKETRFSDYTYMYL